MNECKWCHNRGKKLVVDHDGVCESCRKVARYRDAPMDKSVGGRKTKPVWSYDDVREED